MTRRGRLKERTRERKRREEREELEEARRQRGKEAKRRYKDRRKRRVDIMGEEAVRLNERFWREFVDIAQY